MKSLEEISKSCVLSVQNLAELENKLLSAGYMNQERVRKELDWFTSELGLENYYFQNTSVDELARHLMAISASNMIKNYSGEFGGIELVEEGVDKSIYIIEEISEMTQDIQRKIEKNYPTHRVQSYKTKKKIGDNYLRIYMTEKTIFDDSLKSKTGLTFEQSAGKRFIERSEKERIERYKEVWDIMNKTGKNHISSFEDLKSGETRFMIGIQPGSYKNYLGDFSHLFYQNKIHTNRKYKECFIDGKKIYSFYFDNLDKGFDKDRFYRDLNAVILIPDHEIKSLFRDEILTPMETLYSISAAQFTYQFVSEVMTGYSELQSSLQDKPESKGVLDNIKTRLIKERYSQERIAAAAIENISIIKDIYKHFEATFYTFAPKTNLSELEDAIEKRIHKDVSSVANKNILMFFLKFNRSIIKTNFFLKDKKALSFKINTDILDPVDFPEKTYAIFFLVGFDFIGFHIRFRDISRGGIRLVRSRNLSAYETNLNTIILENYNLANTQQKKNKDIPEGGSKGTILLNLKHQESGDEAFKSYVSALFDLIIPNKEVFDRDNKQDILFLGPDEGTAELMNWAPEFAKNRGFEFWKSITTGKSAVLGGVPHDTYGMTTTGVHEHVLCLLEKLGIQEESITKFQTGGPDGDLGSNEILMSKDKTIAIVDGSGVVCDPEVLNRDELIRLAKERKMVEHFDRSKLSKKGFFVSVKDQDITLPDGTKVTNGEEFRNKFHLTPYAKADLFVPCGGRPAAININNWKEIFDSNGKCNFKFVVEGANLFITEQARLRLEENGVILIKDAAANKGGVTSSSFEVYAGLATSDEEFIKNLTVQNDVEPEFRKKYVEVIINRIKENSRLEFEQLWNINKKYNIPFTNAVNILSKKINDITDSINSSDIVKNKETVAAVIKDYTPKVLLDLVGVDNILKRVPENYLQAIVSTRLATKFVYKYGPYANEIDFYYFLKQFVK